MERVKLNPLGKTYYFNFNEYSCYKCKTGLCPLDNMTLDEIRNLQATDKFYIDENSEEYCVDLARKMLIYDYSSGVLLYHNTECGHYSLNDGQHRTCIIARLYQKGSNVNFEPYFTTQPCRCSYCVRKEHYINLENNLKFYDKLFKTKKYKEAIEYKKMNHNFNSLYHFDSLKEM